MPAIVRRPVAWLPFAQPKTALLTRRRQVDYCRVATALCPCMPGSGR